MTAILAARAPGLPGRTSGAPITSSRTVRRRNTTLSTGVLGGWSGWSDMSDLSDASGWSRWSGVSGGSVHGTSRIPAFLDQAWGVSLDQKTLTETIPQQLFALSIIPYAGFLYHLTKSKKAPKLTLFGFYFLLVFVFATIPAGIYAKKVYQTTLANVDYLHGSAEFMLTLTNLFIVVGLKMAIDDARKKRQDAGIDTD